MAAGRKCPNGTVQGCWKHGYLIKRHVSASTVSDSEPKPWVLSDAAFDGVDCNHLWPGSAQPSDLDTSWTDPNGDSLIVLGGSASDGVMGDSSYRRAVYAVLTYQQGAFHHIVLSGGGGSGRSIAEVMKEYMVCRGVPPDVIILEPASNNTRENALFTKPLIAKIPGTKVLLTSDYHMTRAHRVFAKAGIHVLPRPFPDALKRATSPESRWGAFVDLVRETAALGYYFARGWI